MTIIAVAVISFIAGIVAAVLLASVAAGIGVASGLGW